MRRSSLLRLALLALLGVVIWFFSSQPPIDPESTREDPLPLSLSKQDDPAGLKQRNDPSDAIQVLRNQKRSPPLGERIIRKRSSDSSSVAVLQGWVTDLGGRPVPGVTILLRPSAALSRADPVQRERILRQRALGRIWLEPPQVVAQGRTAADGHYLIQAEALTPAVYQVVAGREDFSPQRQYWTWMGESGEVNFQLGPGPSISGRVLDLEGNSLAGAEIEVLTQGDEGRGNWLGEPELIDQTRSGAGGFFRLSVYPGLFQLKARAQGFAPLALRGIAAGSQQVQMKLSPGRRLKGVVLDQQGQPVPDVEVAVWLGEGVKHRLVNPISLIQTAFSVPHASRITDFNGEFQFEDLPTGAFGLLAQRGGYRPSVKLGEIREDSEITAVELQLASGSVLSGRVIDLEERPVPGALVVVGPSTVLNERQKRARVAREQLLLREGRTEELEDWYAWQAQSAHEQPYQPISLYRAIAAVETDTEGRFRLDTLEEKGYDFSVVADDLLPYHLENVGLGQGVVQLTVILESGVGMEGQVFSSITGRTISGATVVLGRGAHRRVSKTDWDGRYHFRGLLDKEIERITVRAEGFALKILESVDISGGSQVRKLDLELEPALQVSGTVVDPAGIPASGAWVHVQPAEESLVLAEAEDEWYAQDLRLALRVSAQSDAVGHFELNNVNPASALEVCVRHPEFQVRCTEPFEALSGQQVSGFQIQLGKKRP